MADTITDNRTQQATGDSIGGGASEIWAGSTSPALDTTTFIEGTGSIAEQITDSRRWVMWDNNATQNLANNVVYVWLNCGVVGLLDTLANGGMRIRVAGASSADFKEWNVGGNDSWPPLASKGGWVQFVVDLESTADAAGGAWSTTQANTAIQFIGYSAITTAMTIVGDNMWIDSIWTLADGTAGILVQGKSGGTTAWTWDDIVTQVGLGSGAARAGPAGTVVLNTSIDWFIDDGTDHAFDSTNDIVLLDSQATMPADLYLFRVLGAATGTSDFTLGIKTGTGDDASGAQGTIMVNTDTALRYTWDTDIANIDTANVYGSTFLGGGTFNIGSAANEWISCSFLDCQKAVVTNSLQLRNSIINPSVVVDAGDSFMETDDLTDIRFCSFEAQTGDGHAVELVTPLDTVQTSKGNKFAGFGVNPAQFNTETGVNGTTEVITTDAAHGFATSDAIYYNDKGGTETIGLTDGNQYWVRNLTSTTVSLHTSAADAGTDTARVNLTASGTGLGETHELGDETAAVFNDQAGAVTISVTDLGDGPTIRNGVGASTTVSNDVNVTVTVKDEAGAAVNLAQVSVHEGTDPENPGAEVMNADTNASGIATTTFNFVSSQPIIIRIRKSSTGTTRYFPVAATGTITAAGFTLTRTIVLDNIVEA